MKKMILLGCLISFASFASGEKSYTSDYQELCAKEQDPVKRHHYCHLFEKGENIQPVSSVFRKDVALG